MKLLTKITNIFDRTNDFLAFLAVILLAFWSFWAEIDIVGAIGIFDHAGFVVVNPWEAFVGLEH